MRRYFVLQEKPAQWWAGAQCATDPPKGGIIGYQLIRAQATLYRNQTLQ